MKKAISLLLVLVLLLTLSLASPMAFAETPKENLLRMIEILEGELENPDSTITEEQVETLNTMIALILGDSAKAEVTGSTDSPSAKYEKAVALMERHEYEQAAVLFSELGDYIDSSSKLVDCQFLVDVADAVLTRRDQNSRNIDFLTITNTELALLEKYESLPFADTFLQVDAKKYIRGLRKQKSALSLDITSSDFQITWQEGMIIRFEVLSKLYKNYGLLENDREFVGTYVAGLEGERKTLIALRTIDNDLHSQLDVSGFKDINDYEFRFVSKYKNNTDYTFDVSFYFVFYKIKSSSFEKYKNDLQELISHSKRVGDSSGIKERIVPGSSTKMNFYQPTSNWTFCDYSWTIDNIVFSN